MKVKYTNRHKEVQTFEVNERGNIQWTADFEFNRVGFNDDPKIMMVDPSGGPYINLGYDMGIIDKSFDGMIVKGFISNDDGWEIVINKEQTVWQVLTGGNEEYSQSDEALLKRHKTKLSSERLKINKL